MSYAQSMFLGLSGAVLALVALQSDADPEPVYNPVYVDPIDYGPLPQYQPAQPITPSLEEWSLPDAEMSSLQMAARRSMPAPVASPETAVARFEKAQNKALKALSITDKANRVVSDAKQQAAIKAAQAKVDRFTELARRTAATKKKMDDQIARITKLGKSVKAKDIKTLDQRNREHRTALEAVNREQRVSQATIASTKQALRSL